MNTKWILFILAFVPAMGLANEKGNGGGAYICQDPTQSEFLDLYEARQNGLTIQAPSGDLQSQIQGAFNRLGQDSPLYKLVLAAYAKVQSAETYRSSPPPQGEDIAWPSDEQNVFGKKDCAGKGIILFNDLNNSMIWDEPSLKSLPTQQQAAAWVHESIYKFLRDGQGDPNSVRAQQVVGLLFSTETDDEVRGSISKMDLLKPHKTIDGYLLDFDVSNPQLGLAFRDQYGLIWGDVAQKDDNTLITMDQPHAAQYCASIGARLPSVYEMINLKGMLATSDAEGRLLELMINANGETEVLPNLFRMENGANGLEKLPVVFWSMSHPIGGGFLGFFEKEDPNQSLIFSPHDYTLQYPSYFPKDFLQNWNNVAIPNSNDSLSVRCVMEGPGYGATENK